MKKCIKCGESKSLDKFHTKRGKPQAQCKTCRAKYMADRYADNRESERAKRKKYYADNKDKILAASKKNRLENAETINFSRRLKKYGLTKEQYFEMWESQGRKCANQGCTSQNQDMAIDHCHSTGKVRGILCDNCNTALGLLKESAEAIEGIKTYLKKYKK